MRQRLRLLQAIVDFDIAQIEVESQHADRNAAYEDQRADKERSLTPQQAAASSNACLTCLRLRGHAGMHPMVCPLIAVGRLTLVRELRAWRANSSGNPNNIIYKRQKSAAAA